VQVEVNPVTTGTARTRTYREAFSALVELTRTLAKDVPTFARVPERTGVPERSPDIPVLLARVSVVPMVATSKLNVGELEATPMPDPRVAPEDAWYRHTMVWAGPEIVSPGRSIVVARGSTGITVGAVSVAVAGTTRMGDVRLAVGEAPAESTGRVAVLSRPLSTVHR
jgi:hypothetical protein